MRELAQSENQRWRQRWGGSAKHSPSTYNLEASKLNGAKGGRPRTRALSKMSNRAATINRMMKRGLDDAEIAELLGTTERTITDTKRKYRLPRAEDV